MGKEDGAQITPADGLQILVDEARQIQKPSQLDALDFSNFTGMFNQLLETPEFALLYNEFRQLSLSPLSDERFTQISRRFSGKILQDLATSYFRNHYELPVGATFMSGKSTLELMHFLYPDRAVLRAPFGLDSIQGTSVPDGLVVQTESGIPQIIKLFEATINEYGVSTALIEKINGLNKRKRDFPSIFSNSSLLIAAPRNSSIHDQAHLDKIKLPFTIHEFIDRIRFIVHKYTPQEDSATIKETQLEAREQYKRASTRIGTPRFTLGHADYLTRRGIVVPFSERRKIASAQADI